MKVLKTYCESLFDVEDSITYKVGDEIFPKCFIKSIKGFDLELSTKYDELNIDELMVIKEVCGIMNLRRVILLKSTLYLSLDEDLDLDGIDFHFNKLTVSVQVNAKIKNGSFQLEQGVKIWNYPDRKVGLVNFKINSPILEIYGNASHLPNCDSKSSISVDRIEFVLDIPSANPPTRKIIDRIGDIQDLCKEIGLNQKGILCNRVGILTKFPYPYFNRLYQLGRKQNRWEAKWIAQ